MRSKSITIQEPQGTINETSGTHGTKPIYYPETWMIKQCHDLQGKDFEAKVEKEINIASDHLQDKRQRGSTMIVRYGFNQQAHEHTTNIGMYLRKLSWGQRSTKGLQDAKILVFAAQTTVTSTAYKNLQLQTLIRVVYGTQRVKHTFRTQGQLPRRKQLPFQMQLGTPPDDDDILKKTPELNSYTAPQLKR